MAITLLANPDSYIVRHDETLAVAAPGVLANDIGLLGSSTAVLYSDVSHGELSLRSDGGFSYDPDAGYVGTDSFRYRARDGLLYSLPATVTITVGSANPTPTPPQATPTPPPLPLPTVVLPLPTVQIPLPTIRVPLPSPTLPMPTVRPPLPTATPTRSAAPSTSPPSAGPDRSADPAPSEGGNDGPSTPSGPNGPGVVDVPPIDPFTPIDGIGTITIGGFDWVIPSLVLSVPGLLLILAILAQTGAGVLSIPLVRRSLGGSGLRRRRSHTA